MGEIRLPRHVFLWSMAIIYTFAFASLYVQIPGLYGNQGVLPVRLVEPGGSREQLQASPSLLWLGLGPELGLGLNAHQVMELLCLLGLLLALGAALLEPLRDSLVFLALWALYLSLCQVGQDFLRFPWDSLLLEAGFLTVLIAPLNLFRGRASFRHHDAVTFWLARWLLFRLTFGSGVAKLASHSPSWWGLSAVSHRLVSQGSPSPLAWFARQQPDWLLRLSTVGVLVSETAVPMLFFAPIRCLRLGAFCVQLVYQGALMLTGNMTLLNLLSVALSFSLLDDELLGSCLGHAKKRRAKTWGRTLVSLLIKLAIYVLMIYCTVLLFRLEINWEAKTISSKIVFTQQQFDELLKLVVVPSIWLGVLSLTWELVAAMLGCVYVRGCWSKLWALIQWALIGSAAVAVFALSVVPYMAMERSSSSKVMPVVREAYGLVERYRLVSGYALDTTVNREDGRPEVVLEGSMDNATWTEIEFMYKPGNVGASPPVLAPYQARLDWQLWQAAQGPAQHSPWFTSLVQCLLQGRRDVISLLQTDQALYPFSKAPPTYIRGSLYKYWFTQRNKDGSSPKRWWRRQFVEEFYPKVQLGDAALEEMLNQHGLKEKSPVQPNPDTPLAQALRHVRGHVEALPGPLVLRSLFATVAVICLLKSLLLWALASRKTKAPTAEPKAKRLKEPSSASGLKPDKENSEERTRDSDRSPRKRK